MGKTARNRRKAARLRSTQMATRQPGTDMPPSKGAPGAVFPVAVNAAQKAVAPPPLTDRYPLIVGQSLNATYIGSVFRLATTGYRLQLVDLLDELLEHDPHLFAVLSKRILSTANGRVEVVPVTLGKEDPEFALAQDIADLCQAQVDRIPDLAQCLATLLWGLFYAVTASEIFWTRDADGWHVERLQFIHSRRLAYPDSQSYSLHIWDQGQVLGWGSGWGSSPSNAGTFGLRIEDYPGKFIVYAPQLRGDYPTREGLGRQVAIWAMFKRLGARGGADYLERFAKSFMDVSFSTPGLDGDGGVTANSREATDEDIAEARQAAASIGPGSGSFFVHPSSVEVNPKSFDGGSSSKLTWPEWIGLCNAEESKAVLGGTLGTDVGKGGGNRALGEVQERAEADLEGYDAKTLGESLRRDLFTWIVRLNRPQCLHLVPHANIHVDNDPDPKALLETAKSFVSIGGPVDLDELSENVGMKLVPNEGSGGERPKPRGAFMSDVLDPTLVYPDLMSEEAKQAAQDQVDADNEAALAKAKQPAIVPGAPPAGGKAPKPGLSKTTAKKTASADAKTKRLRDDVGDSVAAAIGISHDADGRILTISRPESTREMALPGGIVDPGETPAEALIREFDEELGIQVQELRHVAIVRSPVDGRPVHVFVIDAYSGEPKAAEEGTRFEAMSGHDLFEQSRLFRPTLRELAKTGLIDASASP